MNLLKKIEHKVFIAVLILFTTLQVIASKPKLKLGAKTPQKQFNVKQAGHQKSDEELAKELAQEDFELQQLLAKTYISDKPSNKPKTNNNTKSTKTKSNRTTPQTNHSKDNKSAHETMQYAIRAYKKATDQQKVAALVAANAQKLDLNGNQKRIMEAINSKQTFVAQSNNQEVLGFATITPADGYIDLVAVDTSKRRNGIGTKLTVHCIKILRDTYKKSKVQLVTDATNINACKLYEKLKFTLTIDKPEKGYNYSLSGTALSAIV